SGADCWSSSISIYAQGPYCSMDRSKFRASHSVGRGITVGKQPLGELVQQFLLLLVGAGAGFFAVAFDQLAQGFHPLIALAPGLPGALQAGLIPAHGLALLLDGGLHLRHEALVIEQPVTPDALAAA